MKKFFWVFLFVFGCGYVFLALNLKFSQDFSYGLAQVTHLIAAPFDTTFIMKPSSTLEHTLALGIEEADKSFFITITEACTALSAMLILYAAVLAFPASWRSKLGAILIGSVVIQAVNVIRLISLVYIGFWFDTSVFDIVHENIWPLIIYFSSFGCFLGWVSLFTEEKAPDATSP